MTAELQTPLQDFLQYLEQQRRVSPHTVLNYQRDCQQLVDYCEQQSFTDWQQLKPADIRLFIARLHRKGLGARSIHRLLSAIRSFYRYLLKEGLVDHNPAQSVQAPKAEKRLPKTLDVDQMNSLLDSTPADTFVACRDRAIMELFYSSGLRLAELAALDLREIGRAHV